MPDDLMRYQNQQPMLEQQSQGDYMVPVARNALRTRKNPKAVNALKGDPRLGGFYGNESMLMQQQRQAMARGARPVQSMMEQQQPLQAPMQPEQDFTMPRRGRGFFSGPMY